jgi:hypothetical protein
MCHIELKNILEACMARNYSGLNSWQEVKTKIEYAVKKEHPKNTELFDALLLKGGNIQDIHNTEINTKEKYKLRDKYSIPGDLYRGSGTLKRTLFGHIGHLINNEKLIIEIGGKTIGHSTTDEFLNKEYANNSFIRIEGVNDKIRPDKADDKIGESLASIANYLPTKMDVDTALHQMPHGVRGIDAILDQVEKNILADGRILKDNWRMITERNIQIWFK